MDNQWAFVEEVGDLFLDDLGDNQAVDYFSKEFLSRGDVGGVTVFKLDTIGSQAHY